MSMGILARLTIYKRPLIKEIQSSKSKLMVLGIWKKGRLLASIEVRPTLIEKIKAYQIGDESLNELRKKIVLGKAHNATIDVEGVLRFKGRICVPRVDFLIIKMFTKSQGLRYFIHPVVTKMYTDLIRLY